MMNKFFSYSYRIVLLLSIIYIWGLMYWAHKSEYDENYGFFIVAMLISFIITLSIVVGWIWKRITMVKHKFFWIIISSASIFRIYFIVYICLSVFYWPIL